MVGKVRFWINLLQPYHRRYTWSFQPAGFFFRGYTVSSNLFLGIYGPYFAFDLFICLDQRLEAQHLTDEMNAMNEQIRSKLTSASSSIIYTQILSRCMPHGAFKDTTASNIFETCRQNRTNLHVNFVTVVFIRWSSRRRWCGAGNERAKPWYALYSYYSILKLITFQPSTLSLQFAFLFLYDSSHERTPQAAYGQCWSFE